MAPLELMHAPGAAVAAAARLHAAAAVPFYADVPMGRAKGRCIGRLLYREALRWIHACPSSAAARVTAARLGLKQADIAPVSSETCDSLRSVAESAASLSASRTIKTSNERVGQWTLGNHKEDLISATTVCASEAALRAQYCIPSLPQPEHLTGGVAGESLHGHPVKRSSTPSNTSMKPAFFRETANAAVQCQFGRLDWVAQGSEAAIKQYQHAIERLESATAPSLVHVLLLLEKAHAFAATQAWAEALTCNLTALKKIADDPRGCGEMAPALHLHAAEILININDVQGAKSHLAASRHAATFPHPVGTSLVSICTGATLAFLQGAMGLGEDRLAKTIQKAVDRLHGAQPATKLAQAVLLGPSCGSPEM
mmetsp:Transcript_17636/g.34180  ORF Transcript_17636/g.34180 Transcript_17636/m.34180 type:complete len:369 (+) Transcript_17636:101-1207(+)